MFALLRMCTYLFQKVWLLHLHRSETKGSLCLPRSILNTYKVDEIGKNSKKKTALTWSIQMSWSLVFNLQSIFILSTVHSPAFEPHNVFVTWYVIFTLTKFQQGQSHSKRTLHTYIHTYTNLLYNYIYWKWKEKICLDGREGNGNIRK